jgi:hypothetical protein
MVEPTHPFAAQPHGVLPDDRAQGLDHPLCCGLAGESAELFASPRRTQVSM